MKKLNMVIKQFEDYIDSMEVEETYKNILGEIPSSVISMFPPALQKKFKSVYKDLRTSGNTKEKSLNLTSRLVSRGMDRNGVNYMFVEMQKALLAINEKVKKGSFFQDSTDAEKAMDEEDITIEDEESPSTEDGEDLG